MGDAPEGGVSLPPGAIADHSAFDLPSSQSLERSSKLSRDNGMLEVTRELDVSRKDSAEDETRARTRSEEELEARNNLPEGWAVQVGEKGDQWYYNELTQDVSFQLPEAPTQVPLQRLPPEAPLAPPDTDTKRTCTECGKRTWVSNFPITSDPVV